jgi:hypothetical protein
LLTREGRGSNYWFNSHTVTTTDSPFYGRIVNPTEKRGLTPNIVLCTHIRLKTVFQCRKTQLKGWLKQEYLNAINGLFVLKYIKRKEIGNDKILIWNVNLRLSSFWLLRTSSCNSVRGKRVHYFYNYKTVCHPCRILIFKETAQKNVETTRNAEKCFTICNLKGTKLTSLM